MTQPPEEPPVLSFLELRGLHDATLSRHQRGELALGEDLDSVLRRLATGALLYEAPSERSAIAGWIDHWRRVSEQMRTRAHAAPTPPAEPNVDPPAAQQCPFPGVRPFERHQSNLFFGRDALIDEIVKHLQVHSERALTLIGPAGSGKTSLIEAGIIPAMADCREPAVPPRTLVVTPGPRPLLVLANALNSRQPHEDAQHFAQKSDHALHLARTMAGSKVLIIDQLEELVTRCQDEQERRAFGQVLVDLTSDAEAQTQVIVALDSRHEAAVGAIDSLSVLLNSRPIRMPSLDAVQLRDAITRPDPELCWPESMVDDWLEALVGHPESLVLTQHLICNLWHRRVGNQIPDSAVAEYGNPIGGLVHSAERCFQRLLAEEQRSMERLLERLVSRNAEGQIQRCITLRSTLRGVDDPSRVDRVLEQMIQAQLVGSRPIERDAEVQLSLNTLITSWPRLVTWTERWKHHINLREELTDAIARWQTRGERPRDLVAKSTAEQLASLSSLSPRGRQFLRLSMGQERKNRSGAIIRIALVAALAFALFAATAWFRLSDVQNQLHLAKGLAAQLRHELSDATAKRTRAEIELQHARTVAQDKSKAADDVRRQLDKKVMRTTKLSDELEMTRERLRGNLIQKGRTQLEHLDALVSLSELAVTREFMPNLATGQLKTPAYSTERAKRIKTLTKTLRTQLKWYDTAINSKHRKRDKASLARFQQLRAQLKSLKVRLSWVERRANRLPQLRTVVLDAVDSYDPVADLMEASGTSRSTLLRMLRNENELRLKTTTKALKAAFRKPNRRAAAFNELGKLAYQVHQYPRASQLFGQASRYSARSKERAVYASNRVRAILAQSRRVTGRARIELLKMAAKSLERMRARPPLSGELEFDVQQALSQAQVQLWSRTRK
ncbi:MAG: hypothetical protein CMH53_10070 [Myxococcales bacterium]|nr:hypothetical protein [Myxococcales bacterium]